MDNVIVATVQQQMRVFEKQEDYQEEVYRYMRMAQSKGAKLIVFPALSPVMLVPPLVSSPRLGLLKQAEKGQGRWASLLDRMLGRAADAAGQAIGGGLRGEMNRLLNKAPEALYEAYIDLFSAAALKFRMTVVAGSFYLRTGEVESSKHVCFVFGPNGQIIGQQEKVHLTVEEMRFCQAGLAFNGIETEVGPIGILIGEDVLFPESGRLLAYQRAELLINLVACDGVTPFAQLRHAFVARLDENELMGAQSCLIGPNRLTASEQDFTGKSALLMPIPLSSHFDGILFEMGAMTVEGIIAEPMDLARMQRQWASDVPRLRQGMRVLAYRPLGEAYRSLRTLDQAYNSPAESLVIPASPISEILNEAAQPKQAEVAQPQPDETAQSKQEDPAELERRRLNLTGSGKKPGLNLLNSPFSHHESEEDEDSG
jgi:predicted amidohydrolase